MAGQKVGVTGSPSNHHAQIIVLAGMKLLNG